MTAKNIYVQKIETTCTKLIEIKKIIILADLKN